MNTQQGSSDRVVVIHTDGSARRREEGEGFPGGFAFIVEWGDKRLEKYGWANKASSNQMEMSAIYSALKTLSPLPGYTFVINSDSQYTINCITRWYKSWEVYGWKTAQGDPVKNRELIEACVEEIRRYSDHGAVVVVKYVPGHVGILENERADFLASRARKGKICNIKTVFEIPGLDFHQHQPTRRVCPTK